MIHVEGEVVSTAGRPSPGLSTRPSVAKRSDLKAALSRLLGVRVTCCDYSDGVSLSRSSVPGDAHQPCGALFTPAPAEIA